MDRENRQKNGFGDDAGLNERSGPTPSPNVEAEERTLDEEADAAIVRLARDLYRLKRERPGQKIPYVDDPVSNEEIKEALRTMRNLGPERMEESRRVADEVMERVRKIRALQSQAQPEDDPDSEK